MLIRFSDFDLIFKAEGGFSYAYLSLKLRYLLNQALYWQQTFIVFYPGKPNIPKVLVGFIDPNPVCKGNGRLDPSLLGFFSDFA